MDENDPASKEPSGRRQIDADRRESRADRRESNLDAREDSILAEETVNEDRKQEIKGILDDADDRDQAADARDALADARDRDANLDAFLHGEDLSPGLRARRSAGVDRSDSKTDRAASADDRSKLTE